MQGTGRVVMVVGLAVVGFGVLGWRVLPMVGVGGREVRSAAAADGRLDAGPEPIEERSLVGDGESQQAMERRDALEPEAGSLVFDETKDAEQAAMLVADGVSSLSEAIGNEAELSVPGTSGPMGLAESWRAIMEPLVAGDEEAFGRGVGSLGGLVERGEDGRTPAEAVFGAMSGYFVGASFDFASARAARTDPDDARSVPIIPKAMRSGMDAGAVPMMVEMDMEEGEEGPMAGVMTINLPLQGVFPDAAGAVERGGRVVEVLVPSRFEGSKAEGSDTSVSWFMAWNMQAKAWQPVAAKVRLNSAAARAKMDERMRGAQRRH